LDFALSDLKQSMSDEFTRKQKEFESLRKSFEDLMFEYKQKEQTLSKKDEEIQTAK